MDKVSIILNSFNQDEYFENAISSVLNQSYINFELIISENGSTDNSKKILKKYKSHNKIKILDYKDNDIIGKRLNQAINQSSGEYISFLYSDDYIERNKIELQIKEFKNLDEDFGVVYSDVNIFNEYNSKSIKRKVIKCDGWCLKYQLENIHMYGHIDMVSPLIRKKCLLQYQFLENIFAEGEGILLRIAQSYKFKYIPNVLAHFRDTKFNKGKAIIQNLNFHKSTLNILKKNVLFNEKQYIDALNKYIFFFELSVAWGNLRANGSSYETKKIILNLIKKKNIFHLNLKFFIIIFLLPFPEFLIKFFNYLMDKAFNVRTNNIFIENYGGKNAEL